MLFQRSTPTCREQITRVLTMEALESRVFLNATLLDPSTQPRFVNELTGKPPIMQPTTPGGTDYVVSISQFQQQLGLFDPTTQSPLRTSVWGYNGSYPGATFEAEQGTPINVRWINNLVDAQGNPLPHLLPVDTTLHWANPPGWPKSGVPVVTHLHGGHSESASDGLPDAWFTPDSNDPDTLPDHVGDKFNPIYHYDNDQEATTLWYHDHALGITRLNVYAGLAGFYLVHNAWERSLDLPSGKYDIPLVIQDRMFTSDGQLYYPSEPMEGTQADEPSVLPEFFGNFILVNGKAWPHMNVEPRKYRFRLLNGSDSRFYSFHLSSGQPFDQIGSDQGLLNKPVKLDQLTLGPGERADVILDFSKMKGQTIVLRNDARTPFPAGDPVDPASVGQIMAFRVIQPLQGTDRSVIPATLRPAPIAPPALGPSQTQPTVRQLLLFEGKDELGRIMPLLGTARDGALQWDDPTTENPHLNDVEIWEIYNTTVDTHPIHLHLVHFQVLNRQKFTATQNPDTGALTNIRLMGSLSRPQANEAGLKDTVQMPPGQVTRIIAKFDREGEYVWHCHILSHEDHEMMRRIEVLPERVPTSADLANVAAPAAPATAFSTKPITAGLPMREDPLPTPAAPVS